MTAQTDEDRLAQMKRLGREPCCPEDWGGSHYHCARCSRVSGMYGCYRSVHWNDPTYGKTHKTPGHFCCPKDGMGCEIEVDPEGFAQREAELEERLAASRLEREAQWAAAEAARQDEFQGKIAALEAKVAGLEEAEQ